MQKNGSERNAASLVLFPVHNSNVILSKLLYHGKQSLILPDCLDLLDGQVPQVIQFPPYETKSRSVTLRNV